MLGRFLLGLCLLGVATATAAEVRSELPVREVDLSNGTRRYVVDVQINGKQVEAGLDTGSTGLRVLPRALSPDAGSVGGQEVSYFYTSGTRFHGRAIRVPVSFGGIPGDIRLMRIDRLDCTPEQPRCPAARIDPTRFGIQGDGLPGEGFAAILGIGLKPDAVQNPLEQLGVRRWIVELPTPGSNIAGRLILNPGDAEIAGYKRVSLIGDGNLVPGCLVAASPHSSICGDALLDTGAPGIRIVTDHSIAPWPQGLAAEIAVGGDARLTIPIQIGRRDQASAMFVVSRPGANPPRISFGIAPYFRWSVLYDASARQIGLRGR